MMKTTLVLDGKPLALTLSSAAERALHKRTTPLLAEMELYFSCLIRLKVRFHDASDTRQGIPINDLLQVSFHPVMTASCGNDYAGDEPPLTDFPIQKPRAFIPRWLRIDYRHGRWQGEFGYQ